MAKFRKRSTTDRDKAIAATARSFIFQVYSFIILKSPKDEGYYQSSHAIDVDAISDFIPLTVREPETIIKEGKQVLSRKLRANIIRKGTTKVYITTNLPYAWPLEKGRSIQAPLGVYSVAEKVGKKIWIKKIVAKQAGK